jgi:hypothetical protein
MIQYTDNMKNNTNKKDTMTITNEYEIVKNILIKHDCLHKDIDQLDDTILMEDLYKHFQEDMPYGTQKARTGDPDEFIYDKLEDMGLPLGKNEYI